MKKIKIVFYVLNVYFISLCVWCFAGVDDEGFYYADSSDQILEWNITIEHLGFRKADGTEVVIIGTATNPINIADPSVSAGSTAGYFAQNVHIEPGTYTTIHFRQGATSSFKGCIQIADNTWRATGKGNTSYPSKADALNAATTQSFTFDAADDEYLSMSPHVTVEAGKSYRTIILWKVYGTTPGIPEEGEPVGDFGVGLVWDPVTPEFTDGFLNETYIIQEIN